MDGYQLAGSRIAIFGGTGSLGQNLLYRLAHSGVESVRIYSRDEDKQYRMRARLPPGIAVEFVIGDVRDASRVQEAVQNVDIVVNAAALKQVPLCEEAPLEAVQTNIVGAANIQSASIKAGVRRVVGVSTDKAVHPANVMGMTKAIQERVMFRPIFAATKTEFSCVRYGNVVGSRGSVVPLFYQMVAGGRPLPITHRDMTRFMLTVDQAIDLLILAMTHTDSGCVWVRKSPSAKVTDLALAVVRILTGSWEYPMEYVGIRPGEKLHEVLVSVDEMRTAQDQGELFMISKRQVGNRQSPQDYEYRSDLARRLSPSEIVELLSSARLQSGNAVAT